MRWKLTPKPTDGETRTVRKFAILPLKIEGHIVLLEHYTARQRYSSSDRVWITRHLYLAKEQPAE